MAITDHQLACCDRAGERNVDVGADPVAEEVADLRQDERRNQQGPCSAREQRDRSLVMLVAPGAAAYSGPASTISIRRRQEPYDAVRSGQVLDRLIGSLV